MINIARGDAPVTAISYCGGVRGKGFFVAGERYVVHCFFFLSYFLFTIIIITIYRK
jgi:hypothetical protein